MRVIFYKHHITPLRPKHARLCDILCQRFCRPFGLLLLVFVTGLANTAAIAAKPLIFAVHPYLSTSEIEKRFSPLVKILAEDIDLPIELRVSADYDAHILAVRDGRADLAYIGPAELLIAESGHAPRILLGQAVLNGRPGLSGHLVTRQPTPPIMTTAPPDFKALRGQRIAFVDKNSTMGYLVPMAVLNQAGVQLADFKSSKFVGSHENVALGVLAGEFDVGAVKDEVFEKYRSHGLRSLAEMPSVPEHVFVTNPRLPTEWQAKLRRSLQSLGDREAGRSALKAVRPDLGSIAPVHRHDFDRLRNLLGMPDAASKGKAALR